MNWKERYKNIKENDMVRVIKPHTICSNAEICCNDHGYLEGNTYTVRKLCIMNGIKSARLNGDPGCTFPLECLERIFG